MTVASDIQVIEKKAGLFLTAHHIVLYLALAGSLLVGTYAVMAKVADSKEARAQAAETALAVEKDHSAQLLAVSTAAQTALAAMQAQRDKENAQNQATIQQLQSLVKIQIAKDKTLPAPDLGHRIETVTGFKQNTITLDSSQNLIVPLPLGQEIAARLDQGEADAATVVSQQKIIANLQQTIVDQLKVISDLNAVIIEDKKVLAAQIDTDAKVLGAERANCRKSKLKWFGAGVVVGFIGHALLKY